jgi:hypothetical protein
MIYKIISLQIPQHWDMIKYALSKTDGLRDDEIMISERFNYILAGLLNDRMHCLVRVDEETQKIKTIMLTEIHESTISKNRYMKILCLYAFEFTPAESWDRDWDFVQRFAESLKCEEIVFESGNHRVMDLAKRVGFVKRFETYGMKL